MGGGKVAQLLTGGTRAKNIALVVQQVYWAAAQSTTFQTQLQVDIHIETYRIDKENILFFKRTEITYILTNQM